MQIAFLSGQEIRQTLNFKDLLAFVEQEHHKPLPIMERTLLNQENDKGEVDQSYLCWHAWRKGELLAIKMTTLFPANNDLPAPLPSIHALIAVFEGQCGQPKALIDATELTYWKTAADSVLGARKLARPDSRKLLIVGAGRLAPYHIRAFLDAFPGLERIEIWNRTRDKAIDVANNDFCKADPAHPASITAVDDLERSTGNADIICSLTGSKKPLILGQWVKTGCHLSLTGSYQPDMRETDDDLVKKARLFVSLRRFNLEHAGDLSQPIKAGVISKNKVEANLYEICQKGISPARAPEDITLYKNSGGAHMDLMTTQYCLKAML